MFLIGITKIIGYLRIVIPKLGNSVLKIPKLAKIGKLYIETRK